MDNSGREDRKLSEVKAVLQRLQGLSSEPDPAGSGSTGSAAAAPPRALRIGSAMGIAFIAVVVILAIAYAFPDLTRVTTSTSDRRPAAVAVSEKAAAPPPASTGDAPIIVPEPALQPTAPPTPPVVTPALEAAVALMTSGHVRAARERLLAMAGDDSPDVLWALARSYDPNFLAAIPAADARPDVAEATRWYRTWYAAAVKQGLVADSVSLERIIGSMRR